jgi:hypothetical protein
LSARSAALFTINLRDYIKHTPALKWKSLDNIDELSPRVRQTLRLDRLLLAAPIRRPRVRHLDRPAQLRAPRLQLPESIQFERCEAVADAAPPIFLYLRRLAADGEVIYSDVSEASVSRFDIL